VAGLDTGAVERGRAIFQRVKRKDGTPIPPAGRCVTCHPPPHYTSRLKSNVGTQGPRDDHSDFDVPHLTGIASKAPYLHDGRALSLEEIWTLPDVGDSHGVVTDLSKAELNDLIEFLRGL
jgi:cytochrome c peroxidase